MRSTTVLVLLIAAALGCHSAPPANRDAHAPGTQPASTASPAPAASQTGSDQSKGDPELLKQGYRLAVRRGETVYCRKQPVTGSRFTADVCLTAQQIKDRQQQAKDDLQTVGAGCKGAYCQ